ncbi:MAG: 50S ribosomal protein L4 [Candidatus Woesearchaeota archaeon]
MMKLKVLDKNNKETKTVTLPSQFTEPVRPDIVKRAVLALRASRRQKYGTSPRAGLRHSAYISKRRHKYKGTYGIGRSRTPSKVMNRSGIRFFFVGANVPQAVGGRRAHPPKANKNWEVKINRKERRKAIRSALSATVLADSVKTRGHRVPSAYPFVLDSSFESMEKTKDLVAALKNLGFDNELQRLENVSIRAGVGKRRGRPKQNRKSVLFVVSKDCPLLRAAKNIAGVDVVPVSSLNAELLAPGTQLGRATLFTDAALDVLAQQNLFTEASTAR